MSLEATCPHCGEEYVVDEQTFPPSGGSFPCQACGTSIVLDSVSEHRAAPEPAAVEAVPGSPEVCCPRCGLHFAPEAQDEATGTRRTVLLVEDLEYFVEIARDALDGRYELKVAGTVDEARAILLRGGIDLMLLDLTLAKGEDGLGVLRDPPGKVCPVLAFSAQDESEMYGEGWARLRALGIDDMVIKGMNMGELLVRKVSSLLGEPTVPDGVYR